MFVTRPTVDTDNSTESHVKEHWRVISDCLNHNYDFVHHCVANVLMPELRALGCVVKVLHQRTDGCASQYKSFNCFGDVSRSREDLDVDVICSYSGSGHGKGEVDAAAGYQKTAARKALIRSVDEITIHSAKELYEFAASHLGTSAVLKTSALHGRRFFCVDKSDVDTERARAKFKTVKGTQKINSARSMDNEGTIGIRHLSCYCIECVNGNFPKCENSHIVEPFKPVSFLQGRVSDVNEGEEEELEDEDQAEQGSNSLSVEEQENPLYPMICKDTVVAIKANLSRFVTIFSSMSNLRESCHSLKDLMTWGMSILLEIRLRDVILNISKQTVGSWFKETKETVVVPAASVIYVGVELEKKPHDKYLLSSYDHDDIMCHI